MKLIMVLITVGIVALLVIASSITSEASSNMDNIPTRAPTEPEGYWKTPTPGGIPPTEIIFVTVMPAPTVVLPATATWAYPAPGDADYPEPTIDPYPLPDSPSETLKDILIRVFGISSKSLAKSAKP